MTARLRIWLGTGLAAGCLCGAVPAAAEVVDLTFSRTLELDGVELPYRFDMRLEDLSPVRIGVEALLDLREIQAGLNAVLDGKVPVDICNARVEIGGVDIEVDGDVVTATTGTSAAIYDCAREGLTKAERGETLFSRSIEVSAGASVEVKDQCVYFHLDELNVALEGKVEPDEDQRRHLARTRTLLLAAAEAALKRHPVCAGMPPDLASLDPTYDSGGTREIGEGGLGVSLEGTVDVSTDTLVDVMQVLQREGLLPPPP